MTTFSKIMMRSLGIVALGATVAACGGDDVSISPIAPGDECVDGGLRITVNGKSEISCSGDPNASTRAEPIAYGAEGNPCSGPAVRYTFAHGSGTPEVAWVCDQNPEFAPTQLAKHMKELGAVYANVQAQESLVSAKCNTEGSEEERADDLRWAKLALRMAENAPNCSMPLLNLADEANSTVLGVLECITAALPAAKTCVEQYVASSDVCDREESINEECLGESTLGKCINEIPESQREQLEFLEIYFQLMIMDLNRCGVIFPS